MASMASPSAQNWQDPSRHILLDAAQHGSGKHIGQSIDSRGQRNKYQQSIPIRPSSNTVEQQNNDFLTSPGDFQSAPDSMSSERSSIADNNTDTSSPYVELRPRNLSRTGSVYSLSRVSFSHQILQLTSIKLPDASSLAESISAIRSSTKAARTLADASEQIQTWIQKASDVLDGLDAGDDVEWAAAAGKDGVGEVDGAISRFESLVQVYVDAVEKLQLRDDASSVTEEDMSKIVTQVEKVARDWESIKKSLTNVKEQVELAMEWEKLRDSVFEEIGSEMEKLSRQVFEMEEKRHRAEPIVETGDTIAGVDIGELETIMEDVPGNANKTARLSRYTLPSQPFPQTSPIQSPKALIAQDDTSLLGLFARMQPLRASLDFLPMKLATLESRAQKTFPSACQELGDRRNSLEVQWTRLESDAESLRKELGEDRWILVFRNAAKQALRMIDSVERSITKLDESLDSNTTLKHAPSTMKKLESYEAKKTHYCPAIERVLGIVERGVRDRLTVNGEILRLQTDVLQKWRATKADIKNMDSTLDYYENLKTQQLRDSVSSVLSSEKSLFSSSMDTPDSSPPSSIHTSSRRDSQIEPVTPYANGRPRRDTSTSSNRSSVQTPVSNRHSSLPVPTPTAPVPEKTPVTRSSAHQSPQSSSASPSQHLSPPSSVSSTRRTPQSRKTSSFADRPRWNVSTSMNNSPIGHNFKPLSATTPSPYAKTPPPNRTPSRTTTPVSSQRTPLTNKPAIRRTSAQPTSPATPHFSRRAVSTAQTPSSATPHFSRRTVSSQASTQKGSPSTSAAPSQRADSRLSSVTLSSQTRNSGLISQPRSRGASTSVAGTSIAGDSDV